MKRRILALLLAAVLALSCWGCDLTNPDKTPATDPPTTDETQAPDQTTAPAPGDFEDLPRELIGKWHFGYQGEQDFVGCSLTLLPDGAAELAKLDTYAHVTQLYRGRWEVAMGNVVLLELYNDPCLDADAPKLLRCDYRYQVEKQTLTLTQTEASADALLPELAGQALTLEFDPLREASTSDPAIEPEEWETVGLPRAWMGQWMLEYDTPEGRRRCYLSLFETGEAEFVIQNGTGELLGLFKGPWMALMGDNLQMKLVPDGATKLTEGRALACDYQVTLAGEYLYLTESGQNGDLLIPTLTGRALRFETTDGRDQREVLQADVLNAISHYYEAADGKPYPGQMVILGWLDRETVQVHVFGDDSLLPQSWYTVNVYTLHGVNEETGETIDFGPYYEGGAG